MHTFISRPRGCVTLMAYGYGETHSIIFESDTTGRKNRAASAFRKNNGKLSRQETVKGSEMRNFEISP